MYCDKWEDWTDCCRDNTDRSCEADSSGDSCRDSADNADDSDAVCSLSNTESSDDTDSSDNADDWAIQQQDWWQLQ